MRITIFYPQVMKMQMSSEIEVSDSSSLKEVKQRILESFWKQFMTMFDSKMGRHGTIHDITLKNRDVEIVTDEELKGEISMPKCSFEALFKVHPLTGAQLG